MLELKPDNSPLFEYQQRSVDFICRGTTGVTTISDGIKPSSPEIGTAVFSSSPGKAIFYVDAGLGKSRMAVEAFARLCPKEKILVLCSRKAMNTWRREWAKWTTLTSRDVTLIEGPPDRRKKLWKRDSQIFVVTYQTGKNDYEYVKAKGFCNVICDECKLWRNRKTKNFDFWKTPIRNMKNVILMDGTLISRGPQDLWTFLSLIKYKTFRSYWKFVNTFCTVYDGPFGKEILGPRNTKELGKLLARHVIRLDGDDPLIASQRPPLLRDVLPIEMTKEQRSLYDQLTNDLLAITDSGVVVATPSQLALSIKLRQLLICPKLIDPKMGYGAGIEQLLLELEDDPHIVIFTPFAKAIPWIKQAIAEAGHREPFVLKGGASAKMIQEVEEGFAKAQNKDRAYVGTTSFAESFELPSAKQCFHLGFEWSQLANIQAEKRLLRLTTPHPVNSWYLLHEHTVDQAMRDVLNAKQTNVNLTFQNYVSYLHKKA